MPVSLASTVIGHGPPALVLHGLFGSGTNWRTIARRLGQRLACSCGGERSDYLTERHETRIHALFPAARIVTIAGAGHWLHAEQPAAVVAQIERFLDEHGTVS